jgi:tartrate-resistant acid phosphatase type 5
MRLSGTPRCRPVSRSIPGRVRGFLLLLTLLVSPAFVRGQDGQPQKVQAVPVALSDSVLSRLPSVYRDEAKSRVAVTNEVQQRLLRLSDEDLTAAVIGQLSRSPDGDEFLLSQLENESSPKLRGRIIGSLEGYWVSHVQAQSILEKHASSDPDAAVALQALEQLRSIRTNDLRKLLQTRLELAKTSGDIAGASKLAMEQERDYSWFGNITLPGFLKVSPPVFGVAPLDKPIRVLAFGDFGTGSAEQVSLAKAMVEYNKTKPFDFGLTLGDNFYSAGMVSPSDPRWQTQWEQLYGPLGIKFYPTFGNHDYGQPDSPAAEILYSDKSPDWRFPAPYYTFTAGPAQFFAVDNINLTETELLWLDQELSKSQTPWKVVYAHYHIYSATRGDNKELIERLLPILTKNHVDVYLNGHDHNLQEVKPEGGVHFFVSGGGGASLYDLKPYDRSVFKEKVNGFTVLEADAKHFKISFVGMDGKEIYQNTLVKGVSGKVFELKGQALAGDRTAGALARSLDGFAPLNEACLMSLSPMQVLEESGCER